MIGRYRISKTFDFAAAHHLDVEPGDPCSRVHGHNYVITLRLHRDELVNGMVADFNLMDSFKEWVDKTLDHRFLNDFIENPTTERVACWIYENMPKEEWYALIYEVAVKETAKTEAVYRVAG